MNIFKALTTLLSVLLLTACVGTNLRVEKSFDYQASDLFTYEINDKASVTEKGMSIFKSQLETKLSQLGLGTNDEGNKVIEITFTNYYIRHGAARALVGVMAGVDNITSTVVIKDSNSGDIVGKIQVVSKNPSATSSARHLIEQHANKIIDYIKTGNS